MSTRHLARVVALQTLFELDFAGKPFSGASEVVERNVREHAPELKGDSTFANELVDGVAAKSADLDLIITKAAPEWPLEKISFIDRNVLRVGLFELLFSDRSKVPAKVAINEAIELAKRFGGDASGRFVNGVLGAVYKEMGEPGKEETSKRQRKDVPYEKMPVERLGGAVVYARNDEGVYLALVHDVFGHWTLSKGKLEGDESIEEGTKREIKEELGVEIKIKSLLGENEYIAKDPEIGKKRKHVTYFLAEAEFGELTLGSSGGLDDAQWFKLADILDLNFYEDILSIVTKAINILLKKKSEKKES